MIRFACPHCGKEVSAADDHAGKKGRCPRCREVFVIPSPRAAIKPAPAAERRSRPDDNDKPPRDKKPTVDLEVVEDEDDTPPARKRSRDYEDDEDEDRPRRRRLARDEEDDEDDDRPVRRRRRREEEDDEDEDDRPRPKRRRRRGPYAECPNCRCRGDATRVYYTFAWGLLPTFFRTVRCNRCGVEYNGKHGDYNTWRYLIYMAIVVPIALVFGFIVAILEHR
jgi:hypothetical protein